MPATVSHALSMTTPDDPLYENQPKHWNSAHAITLNISATEISGLFSNANGISFGLSNSSITASHNALTSQSNQNVTAANGGFAFQTLSFSNVNGFSFGTSAGSAITGSYTVPTVTNSSWTVSDAASSATVGRLAFTNLNGVTLSLSTGAAGNHTIVGSHNALTSQSNQAFSAAGGSSAFQTLGFSDNGYASFTNSNGSVAINELRGSFFATGNTTQSSSGTINLDTLIFRGSGVASVGVSNGSVIVDVPAGGGGITNINVSAGTTSNNLSNIVFANSNLQSFGMNGSTITAQGALNFSAGTTSSNISSQVIFSNANNVSFGMNSNTITASVLNNATLSRWMNFEASMGAVAFTGIGTMAIQEFFVPNYLTGTRLDLLVSVAVATTTNNSSAGIMFSHTVVILTENAGTYSSISSTTQTNAAFWSSNLTGSATGHFFLSAPLNINMTPGRYIAAFNISTAATGGALTTGANTTSLANTISMNVVGPTAMSARAMNSATNNSMAFYVAGMHSATTNFSAINSANGTFVGNQFARAKYVFRIL